MTHFSTSLADSDPLLFEALEHEAARQHNQIELIASENIVSLACLAALGSPITNKTLEGYPGRRFHGGGEFVDIAENAAIERACRLFDCRFANVQPHSGTQANQAVFFVLLKPGDTVLSMDLAAGGHLSHGARPSLSGRWFNAVHYGVDADSGRIDYDQVAQLAREQSPKLLIAGGSAYPREIDFARLRAIADETGAAFLVDMAHFAGLVAGGVHPSPVPYADIVTCTTTKTLRGPRGGVILTNDEALAKKIDSAVFPGVQGSLHSQIIAAKAVALGEALKPGFKVYARAVRDNARALGAVLCERGLELVTGGTDTHLLLVDVSSLGVSGRVAEAALAGAGITCNANPIPGDPARPSAWSGIRLGTAAATTRGFTTQDFGRLGAVIAGLIKAAGDEQGSLGMTTGEAIKLVGELCASHPLFHD